MNRAPWYRPTQLRFPRHVRAGYGFLARWQWFALRFPRLAALVDRGPVREWISRRVWAPFTQDAETMADLAASRREVDEHRMYHMDFDGKRIMADERWPLEGEQPHGPRGAWVYDANVDWRYVPSLAR